jgi:hypothetical protein
MMSMDNLSTALAALVARHEANPVSDFDAFLAEVKDLANRPPAIGFEYRHHPAWDDTWLELDESQVAIVLERGHPVQRRRIMGGWESYIGGPVAPEPSVGMFPIDTMAPRPDVPHAERIFAASKDLYDAWTRGETWAVDAPLHSSYVFFFLETITDAIGDLVDRWKDNGMVGEFPDALAVQDELRRIICVEVQQGTEANAGTEEADPS